MLIIEFRIYKFRASKKMLLFGLQDSFTQKFKEILNLKIPEEIGNFRIRENFKIQKNS